MNFRADPKTAFFKIKRADRVDEKLFKKKIVAWTPCNWNVNSVLSNTISRHIRKNIDSSEFYFLESSQTGCPISKPCILNAGGLERLPLFEARELLSLNFEAAKENLKGVKTFRATKNI